MFLKFERLQCNGGFQGPIFGELRGLLPGMQPTVVAVLKVGEQFDTFLAELTHSFAPDFIPDSIIFKQNCDEHFKLFFCFSPRKSNGW